MPWHSTALPAVLLSLWASVGSPARADEAAIVAAIAAFFNSANDAHRTALAQQIESDPAYDRRKVSRWLHQAALFDPLEPGRRQIRVPIGGEYTLPVALRVPDKYDHQRPYPLLYVLHGQGGSGDRIISPVEHVLGEHIETFVVAAPTGYRQVVIHSAVPPANEHLAILRAVKRTVHVDSDRVFVLGFSRGGHAAWTLAVAHPDQFAGLVTVAGTLLLFDYGKLFRTFLPNMTNTPVLACWGADDVMSADNVTPSKDGGIAGLNRQLCALGEQLELPLTCCEEADKGHSDVDVPLEELKRILAGRRGPEPRQVRHVFRLPYQGHAWWIEAHTWRGPWWDQKPLKLLFRDGENRDDPDVQREAAARAVRGRLGELRGEINGQRIRVYRKKIRELTVWIPDGLIDWDKPISLTVNGRNAFEGKLGPDLLVCLRQAARNYDFDRLRWAGLRFKSGSRTKVVAGTTPFPEPELPH